VRKTTCAFDQTGFQLQLPPQAALFAGHLTVITLVIEAREMENAVERQNFYLVGKRMIEAQGVLPGNVGGNCDFSRNRW